MVSNLFRRGAIIDNSGTFLSDWKAIIDNGTRITEHAQTSNDTDIIYTVPVNKVFYLVSGFIQAYLTADVNAEARLQYTDFKVILSLNLAGDNAHDSIALALPLPLKFSAGTEFSLRTLTATMVMRGGITGYELNA